MSKQDKSKQGKGKEEPKRTWISEIRGHRKDMANGIPKVRPGAGAKKPDKR